MTVGDAKHRLHKTQIEHRTQTLKTRAADACLFPVFLGVCVLLVLWFLCFVFFAYAQTREELERDIALHNEQISGLDKEIDEYERQLAEIGSQKQTLQSTVNGLEIQQKQLRAKIRATRNKIGAIELEIKELGQDIGKKEILIKHGADALGASIRSINRNDGRSVVETVLGGATISSLWKEVEEVERVQVAVRENVAALLRAKESLTETKEETEEKRKELILEQNKLAAEEGSLNAVREAQADLLAETKSQESTYQDLLEQKRAEKITFERTLIELASQLEYTLDPSRIPPAGKGVLRWPLDEVRITQYFGNTQFAAVGAYNGTGHNGIDFRTKSTAYPLGIGMPVRAALSGTIMAVNHGAVRGCQYGKWVLIRHNNGLATLYAHLSDIAISEGGTVESGAVIGYSGDTGYATGPHLHFAVYVAEALSMKQYKCKSGYTVTIPVVPLSGYLNPINYLPS